MGAEFQATAWSRARRPPRRSARAWAIALSLLAHVAIIGTIATVLVNRSALTEAPAEASVELVFAPPPSVPVPEPTTDRQTASAFDVAPPDDEAVTPAAPVPPPPLVRPPAKPAPHRVAVAAPKASVATAEAPAAPLIPARPVAGMESDRPPAYPEVARRRGEQGRVVLNVDVSASGSPLDISVAQGSGFPVLDAAALNAVRQWRFVPATRGGTPVAAVAQVPIRFRLAD